MGEYGIMLVTTEERDLAKKFEVLSFPALGLFRNGEYIPYEGDLVSTASMTMNGRSLNFGT